MTNARLDRGKALRAVIQAHENARADAGKAAKNFRGRQAFPGVSENEAAKVPRIDDALARLATMKSPPRTAGEGSFLAIEDSNVGLYFVFLFRGSFCDWLDVPGGKLRIMAPEDFKMRAVGQTEVYWQGRPGEQFEVRATVRWIG